MSEVPPEVEWFKNIRNPSTKHAYENATKDFMLFTGIKRPEEFRNVTRAYVVAWRDALGDRVGDRVAKFRPPGAKPDDPLFPSATGRPDVAMRKN